MNETTYPVQYYIGDLCYVMHDVWSEVCDLMFPALSDDEISGELELQDGRKIIIFPTAYGDGEYYDQAGNAYSVDSGTIGAIKLSDIRDEKAYIEGGQLHEFASEIDEYDCWCEDGELGFYKVVIDTKGVDYDDKEELDDEDA